MIIAVLEWLGKLSTILAMSGIGWTTTNPIICFIWLAVKSQVMAPKKTLTVLITVSIQKEGKRQLRQFSVELEASQDRYHLVNLGEIGQV